MTIQFNTDKNIDGNETLAAPMVEMISKGLDRFADVISRIEVHLSDENSGKTGQNDKRCLMEARMEGRQPIAITHLANTAEQAVKGAIDKIKNSLETIQGKQRNY